MKSSSYFIILFCLAFSANIFSQRIIGKTAKDVFIVEEPYYFIISKKDIASGKILFKAETNIPDKKEKESYTVGYNDAGFFLIDDQIFIIYDVFQKSNNNKECYVKTMNTKTGKFADKKLLHGTKLNSSFSSGDIRYTPVFSPDFSKFVLLKDNKSMGYDIDPEIFIYDTKTLSLLSGRKFPQKYEGKKRVFSSKITIDNAGNISLTFYQLNEQTKIVAQGFSAELAFGETDLKNIKALEPDENASSGDHFYASLQDYIDKKPIKGMRIHRFHGGKKFEFVDGNGNVSKGNPKELPSSIFSYNGRLMRIVNNTTYMVLAAGAYCHYADYNIQGSRFYSEGWDGELEKFKERKFEDILEQNGLLEAYKNDRPKREFKDNVNDYFNKEVAWQNQYFIKLNKKLQGK